MRTLATLWWCPLQSIHLHQHRACFSLLDYIQGFWREFALTDTTIQHTFTVHERVPVRTMDFSFSSSVLRVRRTGCCVYLPGLPPWLFSPSSTSIAFDRGGTSIVAGLAVRPLTTEFYQPSQWLMSRPSPPFSHPHRRCLAGDESNCRKAKTRSPRSLPT